MVQGFSGWAVDKTNRSTRLFAFRYLPLPLSRAHRRCTLHPRARFLMLARRTGEQRPFEGDAA